jgi:hypothetical protein
MNEFTVPFGTHKGFAGKNFSPYAINLQGLFKIFFSLTANIYIRIQLNLPIILTGNISTEDIESPE